MRMRAAISNDVAFQFRHGFYYAYGFVSLVYILFLRAIPVDIRPLVLTLVITSDPGVLGFFFSGGIILLEKGQSVLENLFVTPLQIREYFLSKVVSLTLLALVTSFVITFATVGIGFSSVLLFLGVILSSILFTLIGIGFAVKAKTLNEFLIISPLYIMIFFLPSLEYLGIISSPIMYLFPIKGTLLLINGALTYTISLLELIYSVGSLLVWCGLAYHWANQQFYKHIILRIGGGR